jgi:hypothetical protein
MKRLALELSDAGILAVGSDAARLLELDGPEKESPGYALAEKNQFTVGKAAEKKAHLFPRLVISHFWDQLNTEALDHPGPYTQQNHAELAYAHLERIWQNIKLHGDEMIMAVPGFYNRDQLSLLLGIAHELSLPIRGYIPIALAASDRPRQQGALFHLDIHLHRAEIIFLKQGEYLTCEDSASLAEKGLAYLHREWVETIAAEFVRSTRFDPLHQAVSEQELFDRLPAVLEQLQKHASVDFEMAGGSTAYRITLSRELFVKKSEQVIADIQRFIKKTLDKHEIRNYPVIVQLTHRVAHLPGFKEILAEHYHAQLIPLPPGAAAFGTLKLWKQLVPQKSDGGISFFTSREWQPMANANMEKSQNLGQQTGRPTHLLYRNLAYPLSEKPLLIGLEVGSDKTGIQIKGQIAGVSRKHCSVAIRGNEVVLKDFSKYGTFVDEARVKGSIALQLGQFIRVGTPGEKLQLIACLNSDET